MLPTPEQREKLLKQRQDYESAAENLEDQLLKLKVIIIGIGQQDIYLFL